MLMEEYSGQLVTNLVESMDWVELKHWRESMLEIISIMLLYLDHKLQISLTLLRLVTLVYQEYGCFKLAEVRT